MSTEIRRSNPAGLPTKRSHIYRQVVRVDRPTAFIFVSGQVARDENSNTVGLGDITAQTEQVFHNLRVALNAEGADLQDLIKITVYLTDFRHSPEVDKVRQRHLPDPTRLPASSLVEVRKLASPDYLIEIEGVAALS
jgi:enamine deaminase RidA (YjgF/YER057c/UK114 family)